MPKTIAVIGALDTKAKEFDFVRAEIVRRGHQALVINTGVVGEPGFSPDVPAEQVAEAGGASLAVLRQQADRGAAVEVMARGIAGLVRGLYEAGRIQAVLGMGGSAGTVIGTSAMRSLPLGAPKVMVSTLASGDTRPYVGTKDVVMFHSVVDVAGVNRVSALIYANAVGAVVGMLETPAPQVQSRRLIAASMFGNTTPLVTRCRDLLEARGFEVLVFHATGTGGETMEGLIREGYFAGVADLTTTEWADELVGGVLSAGPQRLSAAAAGAVPQVLAPGCLDMVNFWAPETVPARFAGRRFNQWAPTVTLMRTDPDENARLGQILAEAAGRSKGPSAILLPLKGVSMLDAPGKEFWWPEADQALFEAVKRHSRPGVKVVELDCNINDDQFAEAAARQLLEFLGA
jgi:uncharacterized protein (UPF0261 family)